MNVVKENIVHTEINRILIESIINFHIEQQATFSVYTCKANTGIG